MEVYFFTGLIIAVAASYLFIPREQHDARGLTLLACMGTAVAVGWVLVALDVPGLLAWMTVTLGTLAVARTAVRRARRTTLSRRPAMSGPHTRHRPLSHS